MVAAWLGVGRPALEETCPNLPKASHAESPTAAAGGAGVVLPSVDSSGEANSAVTTPFCVTKRKAGRRQRGNAVILTHVSILANGPVVPRLAAAQTECVAGLGLRQDRLGNQAQVGSCE